jgi:hypothetical protein
VSYVVRRRYGGRPSIRFATFDREGHFPGPKPKLTLSLGHTHLLTLAALDLSTHRL